MGIISDFTNWFSNLISREPSTEEKMNQIQNEYERSLSEIRKGVADITTQKKKLELQLSELESSIQEQEEKARGVVKNDEEKARRILSRKAQNEKRANSLSSKIRELEDIRQTLIGKRKAISSEIQQIKTKRANMKAKKKAAKARSRVSETLSDIGDDDIESSLKRMQEEVDRLESRAEVYSSGRPTSPESDVEVEKNIERELEDMKQSN
jgi:phage shock protein A